MKSVVLERLFKGRKYLGRIEVDEVDITPDFMDGVHPDKRKKYRKVLNELGYPV